MVYGGTLTIVGTNRVRKGQRPATRLYRSPIETSSGLATLQDLLEGAAVLVFGFSCPKKI